MPTIIPAGTISAFGGPINKIPADWVLCNGALYDRTNIAYQPLFDAIGVTWGGDGANNFAVPDLGGMFLRGLSDTTSADPDKDSRDASRPDLRDSGNKGNSVGSKQPSAFASHNHQINTAVGPYGSDRMMANVCQGDSRNTDLVTNPNPIAKVGGNETRPVNASVYYMIKL